MARGEHVEDRDRALGGELLELGVAGRCARRSPATWRERTRAVSPTDSPRESCISPGRRTSGWPPSSTTPGLEREPRARARLLEQQRDDVPSQRARATAAPPSARARALEQREQLVARQFGAGEEVARQAREDTRRRCAILTWNLFHGRAVPTVPRAARRRVRRALAGWEWDVALLQEVPPWWPPQLAARVRRAGVHRAHVAQPAAAARARRSRRAGPDIVKSWGGGANAILVRGAASPAPRAAAAAHAARAPRRPRGAAGRRRLARRTSTRSALRRADARRPTSTRAARARCAGWAGDAPAIFGGDMNTRAGVARVRARGRARDRPRLRPRADVAARRALDAAALRPRAGARRTDRGAVVSASRAHRLRR